MLILSVEHLYVMEILILLNVAIIWKVKVKLLYFY